MFNFFNFIFEKIVVDVLRDGEGRDRGSNVANTKIDTFDETFKT